MAIQSKCPHCGVSVKFLDVQPGTSKNCPKCNRAWVPASAISATTNPLSLPLPLTSKQHLHLKVGVAISVAVVIITLVAIGVSSSPKSTATPILATASGTPATPSISTPSATSASDVSSDVSTTANKLWDDYEGNAVAADVKYGSGKRIRCTGHVGLIKPIGDTFELGFQCVIGGALSRRDYEALPEQERRWFDNGYPPSVVVRLRSSEKSKLASLEKDKLAHVVGQVRGRVEDKNFVKGYYVVIENAIVDDSPK